MKYHLVLFAVILNLFCNAVAGQTTTSEGILIIDKDHALRGGRLVGTVQLAPDTNYNNDGRLASDVLQKITDAGGNALQIRTFCKFKRNKAICKTFGEIYRADSTLAQVIPLKQHIDSLHASLGFDTATEAIIILFSSPRNSFGVGEGVFHFINGVEGCMIRNYSVCSFIVPGNGERTARLKGKKSDALLQVGKAYFFEITGNRYGTNSRLVRLDYGYRICKAYQQLHDKQRLGQLAEEDYEE